ncbi:histidine phosphotransferase ChpT [Sphingomonas zeicaulis]|uniref:histidine phosphotransferase family protein n=1 Tax=Sphingomonas zeicaulis TaxID=1632740 RepID=UPI003D24FF75
MITAVELASLLCSRLCHDLLSPVGALTNGIELLADERDPEMRARCMDLLADSARASAARLKYFRLAFGAAGGFGETIDAREAKAAIEDLFCRDGRIELDWMLEQDIGRTPLKVLMNLALIAGEALVRGGRISIAAERSGLQTEIVVRAEGPRFALDPALRHALENDLTDVAVIAPRAAPAVLVRTLARENSGAVLVSHPQEPALLFGAMIGPPVG